jgi:ketosteroid isomerase-like protein
VDEHGNVGRMRDALATFNRGDLDAYREFFDDDVVWYVRGTHPMAGAYRSVDALFEYFARAREVTGGSLHIEPLDVVADDRHAGVVARVRGRRADGRDLDTEMTEAFTFAADGRIKEFWALAGDQAAVDAFWA